MQSHRNLKGLSLHFAMDFPETLGKLPELCQLGCFPAASMYAHLL